MKRITVFVLFVLGIITAAAFAADTGVVDAPAVIDVRTEAEWTAGHLEGAILIPHERIGEEITRVASVGKKTKIYLYCRSGRRSGIALEVLKKAGYVDVTNLGSMENASEVLKMPIVK